MTGCGTQKLVKSNPTSEEGTFVLKANVAINIETKPISKIVAEPEEKPQKALKTTK